MPDQPQTKLLSEEVSEAIEDAINALLTEVEEATSNPSNDSARDEALRQFVRGECAVLRRHKRRLAAIDRTHVLLRRDVAELLVDSAMAAEPDNIQCDWRTNRDAIAEAQAALAATPSEEHGRIQAD